MMPDVSNHFVRARGFNKKGLNLIENVPFLRRTFPTLSDIGFRELNDQGSKTILTKATNYWGGRLIKTFSTSGSGGGLYSATHFLENRCAIHIF